MTFASDLARFAKKTEARQAAVFVATVVELRDSIILGSTVTGAPALPIAPTAFPRAGALRKSVTVSYPDENTALIYTTSPYAPDVEENPKGHAFNDGGPHGWALTIAAAPRVVEMVAKRIARYG